MIYSEQKDDTLVALTLAGNQKAYEALVIRYQKDVTGAAYSVTQNHYMAEDAAQDAFVSAWIKLNILKDHSKFRARVCRIAKNCAKNMIVRFRQYISLDIVENYEYEHNENFNDYLISSDENEMLHDSIGSLPEKVKQVIHLHYFEGYSIAEIADMLRIPPGTVKWQLHDGRKKIRKDLCAMNENIDDSFVQKVMKKVEELKQWRLKNNKDGFVLEYDKVLSEVEKLPESIDKYHALADVLMQGWWWLPGEKNDALLARMKNAADVSKNDEVMEFIIGVEDGKLTGKDKIDFMLNKQIPRLKAGGFTKSLGREWFWLGYEYFQSGDDKSGFDAYEKVLSILEPSDVYYANALSAMKVERMIIERCKGKDKEKYSICSLGEEYRIIDGKLRFWSQPGYNKGELRSVNTMANYIIYNASRCDSYLFLDNMKPGDYITGSDGIRLIFENDSATVETPCGKFDKCELWVTKDITMTCKTYYKQGVGIVKQETSNGVHVEVRVLKDYHIVGGSGLMPCAAGNRWEYGIEYDKDNIHIEIKLEMPHADEKNVTISYYWYCERFKYDENDWHEMMLQMRSEYCRTKDDGSHDYELCDITYPMERAMALAKTPLEIAHTKAACAVMDRILKTDPDFNPACTEKGHWNFFQHLNARIISGKLIIDRNHTNSFEWKDTNGLGDAGYPILFNHIYGILQDALGCIWSDDWKPGADFTIDRVLYGKKFKTAVSCRHVESVETKAGTFNNCLKLSIDVSGLDFAWSYRGGKKEYYFAPGVGIVRVVNHFKEDTLTATYDLTSYSGTGEGFMPLADGMMRHYDAIDLTDGFIASSEYTYCDDGNGNISIFENLCGVRSLNNSR